MPISAKSSKNCPDIARLSSDNPAGMKADTDAEHRRQVQRVIRQVREHADDPLRLEDLARIAEASPAHFDRMFKRLTNRGAVAHVRAMRLARSAVALRVTNRPVLDIALEAYENPESFSRAFRAAYRHAPSAYGSQFDSAQKGTTMKDMNSTINLVKVPVTDFERSQKFYRDVLGLEEEFAVGQYGWAQYKTGAIPLCLYIVAMGGGDATPGDELGFSRLREQCEGGVRGDQIARGIVRLRSGVERRRRGVLHDRRSGRQHRSKPIGRTADRTGENLAGCEALNCMLAIFHCGTVDISAEMSGPTSKAVV
jgi:AraC-like DNA-binding protein/catechol 2,3-dioxygenase-like lactoylglutathione lyase family enzyme